MTTPTTLSEQRIRAVLFDLDGTLYAQGPLRVAMACEMGLAHVNAIFRGRPSALPLILKFRRVREELRSADGTGEPLALQQYTAVAKQLGCPATRVQSAVDEWIHRRPLKWLRYCRRPGLVELLDFLAARRVRCGVFSDYPAEDKLAALGVLDRFDLVLSAVDPEIGAFKPHPRGYKAASERWRIPAEEILYVGDRPEVDAVGATAAGMRCAVLTKDRPPGVEFVAVADFRHLERVLDPVC